MMLRERSLLVCVGGGGVGKTTIAASLALAAALAGRRALALTVDPARRLADTLGLVGPTAEPRPVPALALPAGGSLCAMMLDQKRSWDRVVRRHAPSPATAERLLHSPFYRELSQSFAGTHEYLAVEEVCALADTRAYDTIVLDTPPAAHAFGLLDAPARIRGLLDERLVRWLLAPRRAAPGAPGAAGRIGRYLLARLERATGTHALSEAADFFAAMSALFDAFAQRARSLEALLRSPASALVLVTAADDRAAREAEQIAARVTALGLPPAAIVVNRAHEPCEPVDAAAARAALAGVSAHADWLAENLLGYQRLAAGEARRIDRLAQLAALTTVPQLASDVHDLDGLAAIARRLS